MNDLNFEQQLEQLRRGKLILSPQRENGLTEYANKHLNDLKSYVKALEQGYRAQAEAMAAYRGQAKGKTLGQIVRNQWSDGACLGYAAMALIQYGQTCDQTVALLELMEELMEQFNQEYAAEYHQGLKEGRAPVPLEGQRC